MSPPIIYRRDVLPRAAFLTKWEVLRHSKLHWLMECFAESLGVFFYVYAGVGATAAFVLGSLSNQTGVGSLLQVGFGYSFGILMAITICSSTSGGHFSPAVTIAFVLTKRFPKVKALRYIIAQILGAYVACLIVHAEYKHLIDEVEEGLALKGLLQAVQFTPNGTGGILALYVTPGSPLGRVFLNEFITATFLSIVIWGCLDPSNAFVSPALAPWIISFAYGSAIWGFAPVGLALNSARDVGGRLAAITIYGTKANGGTYAAIAALTNILSMIVAIVIYELFLTDSDRVISKEHLAFISVHANHARSPTNGPITTAHSSSSVDEKAHVNAIEHSLP